MAACTHGATPTAYTFRGHLCVHLREGVRRVGE